MKTLYISDLDGTLLNNETQISEKSIEILNSLIEKGMAFTYSTARTSATAPIITKGLNIKLPVILMNGVCIYDAIKKEYIKAEIISENAVNNVISLLKNHNTDCFVFNIEKNTMNTFYKRLSTKYMRAFHDERVLKFNKTFIKTESLEKINNVIYFSIFNKKSSLEGLYNELKCISEIEVSFYRDTYNTDLWYLEIASHTASKYNSAKYLKETYGFPKLVGFGDNLNDIPLFEACDECYAVKNAKSELKEIATGIIEENSDDGVALYLKSIDKD